MKNINPALPQVNCTYNNCDAMLRDSKRIVDAFCYGGPVYVGRAGYAHTQYAMLNVERWDISQKKYHPVRIEFNGLPKNWNKALRCILSDSLSVA